jgi:hypothetical protein
LSKLTYDTSLGGYRTDITQDQLRRAPGGLMAYAVDLAEHSAFHQWRVIPSGTSENGSVRTFFPSLSFTNIVQADHLRPSIPVLLNINSRATTKA